MAEIKTGSNAPIPPMPQATPAPSGAKKSTTRGEGGGTE